MLLDVYFPALEPFKTDQVADVFLFFDVIDFVPFVKILNQLFLKLLFDEDIEKFSILRKIKVFGGFY
jgi:hypothetical protein